MRLSEFLRAQVTRLDKQMGVVAHSIASGMDNAVEYQRNVGKYRTLKSERDRYLAALEREAEPDDMADPDDDVDPTDPLAPPVRTVSTRPARPLTRARSWGGR